MEVDRNTACLQALRMVLALQEHMECLTYDALYRNELSGRLIVQLKWRRVTSVLTGLITVSLSLLFKASDGEMLLHRLDLVEKAVATRSACDLKMQCSFMWLGGWNVTRMFSRDDSSNIRNGQHRRTCVQDRVVNCTYPTPRKSKCMRINYRYRQWCTEWISYCRFAHLCV